MGYIIVMVLAGLIVAVGIFLAVFIQKPEQVQQTGRPTKEPIGPTASVDPREIRWTSPQGTGRRTSIPSSWWDATPTAAATPTP